MHEASETLIANMAVGLADTAASLSHTSGFPLATIAVFFFGPSGRPAHAAGTEGPSPVSVQPDFCHN